MSGAIRVLYTLLGGVRNEADVARFYCTNKGQILKESFMDIDTVRNRNIVSRSGLFHYLRCTGMHDVLENRPISQLASQIIYPIFRLHARPGIYCPYFKYSRSILSCF